MKGLNVLAAFIGGAAVGAAIGILLAPEKGEDTRKKIADTLRAKGINLDPKAMRELVNELTGKLKCSCGCGQDNCECEGGNCECEAVK